MKYKWLVIPFIGNMFEWYEFAIFSSLAVIIGKLFFNSADHFSATMLGFLIYGIAYVVRPLGTFIFGYIGDKKGRKEALSSSLILMCFGTLLIPLIPSYETIGRLSSILLILARILQGISFGGEFSSVVTYTCETAPNGKKGLLGSLQIATVLVAIILGIGTINILHYFYSEEEILLFAWKIPFFLAFFTGVFGIYVRSHAAETTDFLKAKTEGKLVKNPFIYFFKNYFTIFITCATIFLSISLGAQTFTIGSKSVLETIFHFKQKTASHLSILICVITIPFMILAGFYVERIALKKFRIGYTVLLLIVSVISCCLMTSESTNLIILGIILISIVFGCGNGSYPYYFYKKIPTEVRDTGVGFSIAIPGMIAGGFGMVFFMKLFQIYNLTGIYIFVAIINMISIVGLLLDMKYSKVEKMYG